MPARCAWSLTPTARPLAEVRLQLQNGGKLTLMMLARQAGAGAAASRDEKLVYYFLSGQAQQLLAPPGAAAEANSKTLDAKTQSR